MRKTAEALDDRSDIKNDRSAKTYCIPFVFLYNESQLTGQVIIKWPTGKQQEMVGLAYG